MWGSKWVLLHQRYTSWDWLISSPSSVFSRWIRCSKSACTLSVIAVWRAEAGVHNVGAISASLLFMFAKQLSWHFITFIRRRAALRSFEWSIWCHQVASLIRYTWCLAINYRVWWGAHFTSLASLLFVMRRLFGVWSVCYVQLYSSSALQYDVSLHWYSLTSETSVILCFHVWNAISKVKCHYFITTAWPHYNSLNRVQSIILTHNLLKSSIVSQCVRAEFIWCVNDLILLFYEDLSLVMQLQRSCLLSW